MAGSEGVSQLWKKEDWWAVWIAFLFLGLAGFGILTHAPQMGIWEARPADFLKLAEGGAWTESLIPSVLALFVGLGVAFAFALAFMGEKSVPFLIGFAPVFLLALLALFFESQKKISASGIGYPFWALLFGMLISNTIRTPEWIKPAVKTELFIKTGLVLLGAEILFRKILELGPPGLFVAWFVTPIVIIFMFWFGVRMLGMGNKPLVMVIAASTSVCGVSAAIAAAAACKAKKEDLTLAVGMTLIFTVFMMIGMPALVAASGMDVRVGAAWLGGTIDATGAVAAAGKMLGDEALKVAAVVKMIQNILIGVVAFAIALYWTARVEKGESGQRVSLAEIWIRFPKFILGFMGASLFFSFVLVPMLGPEVVEKDILKAVTKNIREWLFCLAFVSIGLESNLRELAAQMVGGKPILLYIIGQSFNLILTLAAAYLAFGGILFAS